MSKIVLSLVLLLSSLNASAETWVHISGISWHNKPGYQEFNAGIGIETQIYSKWSAAIGSYRNSVDAQSIYGLVKYQLYQKDDVAINVNLGGVSGYPKYSVIPLLLPEACFGWLCGSYIPSMRDTMPAAAFMYLRVPLGKF